jgi:4-hydroxyphenylacetate 3-monooxygenase
MSDYIFVTVILPLKPGDEDYAISCVVPNAAPGLKLYPRRPYATGATSVFDYPLSSRFDETDSIVVFDDVLVPWENVFVYKNLELTAGQFSVTAAHVLGNTQSHIRSLAKLQFLLGLIKRCMDRSGRSASGEITAQLGDLATRVSIVEGMILGAEAAAEPDAFGVMRPKDSLLYASQVFQQAMYPALLNQMRGLLGGSVVQLPATVEELKSAESAADIERYVRWPSASGRQRVKLLKLVWDALGSEFASRHLQYEMFYAGEPAAIQAREFRTFNWAEVEDLVDRCLAGYDVEKKDD